MAIEGEQRGERKQKRSSRLGIRADADRKPPGGSGREIVKTNPQAAKGQGTSEQPRRFLRGVEGANGGQNPKKDAKKGVRCGVTLRFLGKELY